MSRFVAGLPWMLVATLGVCSVGDDTGREATVRDDAARGRTATDLRGSPHRS